MKIEINLPAGRFFTDIGVKNALEAATKDICGNAKNYASRLAEAIRDDGAFVGAVEVEYLGVVRYKVSIR